MAAKAIIFDMDGVLTDSEPVINEAAIRGLREYGIDPAPRDFEPFVGMGEDRYIGGVAEAHGLTYVPEMKRRVYQIYLEILPGLLTPFAGVHGLIDALNEAGYDLALASSADRIKVSANLDAIGLPESRFRVITAGEDVRDKKPSPSIYLATAGGLGHEPRQCTVVEDALSGVRAAKSAGMRCAAVATSFAAAELERAGADVVRPCLADLAIADLDPSAQ